MKYLKLFEEWSPKFNQTLQAALKTAQETRKGFGKVAQDITDYASKQVSKEIFTLNLNGIFKGQEVDQEVKIMHKAEVLLEPMTNVSIGSQHGVIMTMTQRPKFPATALIIPVLIPRSESHSHSFITFKNYGDRTDIELAVDIPVVINSEWGNPGQAMGSASPDRYSIDKLLPINVRFSDRGSLEDFLAMLIQSILSSNEGGSPAEGDRYGYTTTNPLVMQYGGFSKLTPEEQEKNYQKLPGLTKEKQDILEFIQKNLLDKDIRNLLM